ncbi:MAG: AAA family ATPase, partial [Victivallales bacterium]|nr:AAA family ATPase [Victivallales bacterium]
MRRKIYDELLNWKKHDDGRSALLIDGARRVGKSWIVEDFAKQEYEKYLLLDFTKVSKEIRGLFNEHLDDLDTFFSLLQAYAKVRLPVGKSLLIFDEVQSFPRAREAIKHLVADGRYHYIETGSLISIRQNVKDILLPSEEQHIKMHPMDFEEFLWATG